MVYKPRTVTIVGHAIIIPKRQRVQKTVRPFSGHVKTRSGRNPKWRMDRSAAGPAQRWDAGLFRAPLHLLCLVRCFSRVQSSQVGCVDGRERRFFRRTATFLTPLHSCALPQRESAVFRPLSAPAREERAAETLQRPLVCSPIYAIKTGAA